MTLLGRIRQVNPGQPLAKILAWMCVGQPMCWLFLSLCYRHRWFGVHNIPRTGPVLLVCNHQSYLDLPVLGVGITHRHFHSMARATLFRNPLFGFIIRLLNAFPVEQGKGDVKSVRTAIDLLQQGHLVLVFPEGSRTSDGQVKAFSPGIMLLIRKAKPVVVPMAVDGVFGVWPIGAKRPRLRGQTGAIYGQPIPAADLLAMPAGDATQLIQQRVENLRLELRGRLMRLSSG